MMWSKRPKPGGKGLRCKIIISEVGNCDRPARRYGQQVKPFWQPDRPLDVGCIECCKMHAQQLRDQGVLLNLIDRRRTANP
jgi:hypothetical protein